MISHLRNTLSWMFEVVAHFSEFRFLFSYALLSYYCFVRGAVESN